jgi:hypothetical protein
MNQENENINKAIRQKLQRSEVQPSPEVWDSIAATLDAKKKKAALIYFSWFGAAAALLLMGLVAYYLLPSNFSFEKQEVKFSQNKTSDSTKINEKTLKLNASQSEEEQLKFENKLAIEDSNLSQKETSKKEIPLALGTNKPTLVVEGQKSFGQHLNQKEIAARIHFRQNPERITYKKAAIILNQMTLQKTNSKTLKILKNVLYKRQLEELKNEELLSKKKPKTNTNAWSLGLAFAPTYTQRGSSSSNLEMDALYGLSNGMQPSFNEHDLPAYTAGVDLAYRVSEKLSVKSGLYYVKQGQRIENFAVLENSVDESSNTNSYFGNIVFDNYSSFNATEDPADFTQVSDVVSLSYYNQQLLQEFELIEIPMVLSYKLVNKKAILSLNVGLNQGILVGNRVYIPDYSSQAVGKTEAVNALIYKSVLGFSLDYLLTRRLYFNLSPTYKYQLNNFNRNALVGEKLHYFELKTGINYRF